jgi:serine/threonine protein kinase
VKFYLSMVSANKPYLVTELFPGGELFSLLQNVGRLCDVLRLKVLCALAYLRENGIIHRDVSPYYVIGFGLSRLGMV